MEVLHRVCAGIDVHKSSLTACVRIVEGKSVRHDVREFSTTVRALQELHEWLRNVLLHRRGADALLDWYASRSAAASDPASHGWFAGYAALVVAESHAQARRDDAARAAYAASIERFAPALQVEANRDSVTHFQCLAHAGLARLALESGATADAAGQLLTALRLRPASAFDADGRGRAPVQTATTPVARLASLVSIPRSRPSATGERTTRMTSWCGNEMSAAKRPAPVSNGRSSSRLTL